MMMGNGELRQQKHRWQHRQHSSMNDADKKWHATTQLYAVPIVSTMETFASQLAWYLHNL